jgi:dolichol-phosphate mannosyltransferase
MTKIFILLPVHNESKGIYFLLESYSKIAKHLPDAFIIYVINDASTDDSYEWIQRAILDFTNIKIIVFTHLKNLGLAGALNTAFDSLKNIQPNDLIVTMDGDNTHNPFLIKSIIEKIEQGADIVIASRYCEQSRIIGLSKFRKLLSFIARVFYQLRWNLHGVRDYTCLYRGYTGSIIIKFLERNKAGFPLREVGFTCSPEILLQMSNFDPVIVEVPMILRYSDKVGQSNMRILRTVKQTLRLLLK